MYGGKSVSTFPYVVLIIPFSLCKGWAERAGGALLSILGH